MEHYSIPEASKRWGFPERRLYQAIRRGDLKAFKFRGMQKGWMVTDEIMEDFMRSGMEVAGEKA